MRWSDGRLLLAAGDQSVGKTSIITRFMYDKFGTTYQVRQLLMGPLHTVDGSWGTFCLLLSAVSTLQLFPTCRPPSA